MKKILVLMLVFAVVFSFAACGPAADNSADSTDEPTVEPTDEPTAEPTVEPTAEPTQEPTEVAAANPLDAVTDGDVYTNNYFGISLSVFTGSIWYTNEEMTETFGVDPTTVDISTMGLTDILPLGMCYDPTSTDGQIGNLNILYATAEIPQDDTQAAATAQLTAQAVDSMFGTQTACADPTAVEFDGHAAYILEMESSLNGAVVMNQAVILIEIEGGNLTLTYTYFTEAQLNAVISSVDSITFSK